MQSLVVKNGGVIQDGECVDTILPGNDVTIISNKTRYRSRKLVLTPGPWAADLLTKIGLDIPLKVVLVSSSRCTRRILVKQQSNAIL